MIDTLYNLLFAIFIIASCGLFGRTLLNKLGYDTNFKNAKVVFSIGIGFGILIYLLIILGFLGLLYATYLWLILLSFSTIGLWDIQIEKRNINLLKSINYKSFDINTLLSISICVIATLYLLVALAPTLDGDSLFGYLITPREYAKQHQIVAVDYAYGSSYPQNGQIISALGFLLRGQILAQVLVVWTMGLLAIMSVYSIGRLLFNRFSALIGVLIWYGMYSVAFISQSAKIDLAWAAFDLLALLAFMHWYFTEPQKRETKWIVLAGFFLGISGGIKQVSVFTVLILVIAVTCRLWTEKNSKFSPYIKSYLALGIPASIALIWVFRTYEMTGLLAYSGGNLQNSHGVLGAFQTLWQMSMLGNAVSLEGPMGKSIGPSILAMVPFALFIKKPDERLRHIFVFCVLMLVLWYYGVQRARHLLPTLALLSLIAGYAVNYIWLKYKSLGKIILTLILISIVLNMGYWSYFNVVSIKRLDYIFQHHNLDRYLETNLPKCNWYPNYPMTKYIRDKLPADAKIAALSSGNSYYLGKAFYGIHPTLIPVWTQGKAEFQDPHDYYTKLVSYGMTHVFISDFVVEKRGLKDAWLRQPEFKKKYLDELLTVNEQHLYVLK